MGQQAVLLQMYHIVCKFLGHAPWSERIGWIFSWLSQIPLTMFPSILMLRCVIKMMMILIMGLFYCHFTIRAKWETKIAMMLERLSPYSWEVPSLPMPPVSGYELSQISPWLSRQWPYHLGKVPGLSGDLDYQGIAVY